MFGLIAINQRPWLKDKTDKVAESVWIHHIVSMAMPG